VVEGNAIFKALKEDAPKQVEARRVAFLGRIAALAMIAGLLLSPNLWVSSRTYPLIPLFDFVPPLSYPLDYALFGLFILLVSGVAVFGGRRVAGWFAVAAVVLAALLALQDISRLHPWFYQYSFMLAAVGLFGLGRLSAEGALNTCRLIVAFTYLWSGLQKANESFVSMVYPWLIEPLAHHLPTNVHDALSYGAYAVPAIEAAIGLGLLVRPARKPAAVGAFLMHAFILLCLGPWGRDWNSVVWPWNLAMIAFVFILFWQPADNPRPKDILLPRQSFSIGTSFRVCVLILFAFMPLFSFFGLWDSYLSASLYSGNVKNAKVLTWNGSAWTSTSIQDLSIKETGVPPYPEEYVFKTVFAKRWCDQSGPPKSILWTTSKPDILTGARSAAVFRCQDVQRE
jgi:hypothetical protein